MDTTELLKPQNLLRKTEAVIIEELNQSDISLNTPEERHSSFLEKVKKRQDEFQIGKSNLSTYGFNAIDDMWLISRSAFNYLQQNDDAVNRLEVDPFTTVLRSTRKLSFPAEVRLSSDNWENMKISWIGSYDYNGLLIPENKFDLQRDHNLQVVGFSSGAQMEIDSYSDITRESGCPAKGLVLNSVFEKYIDTIFRDTTLLESIQ